MLTTQRAPFTIQWEGPDPSDPTGQRMLPGRVDPTEPLEFIFDPPDSGSISELATVPDGRTPTSTTTTGFVEAGAPAVAAAVDVTADPDLGVGPEHKASITLRATFSVEAPETRVTTGTFTLGAPVDKPTV